MSEERDIEIHRLNGQVEVRGISDEAKDFLDAQYGGNIKVDNQTLEFLMEYLRKFGLTIRMLSL